MKPSKITVEWLKEQGACSYRIKCFTRIWPHGAEVNEENIRRAQQEGFDIDWFARHYLTAQAYNAYDEAMIPARSAFDEARVLADCAFDKAMIPAYSTYREAVASALIEIVEGG